MCQARFALILLIILHDAPTVFVIVLFNKLTQRAEQDMFSMILTIAKHIIS